MTDPVCQKCKTTENVQSMEILGRLMTYCEKCFQKAVLESRGATVACSEHYFTSPTEDQGKAMDEATAYGTSQPWDLISIFWTHQNDAGHHCFTISYMPKKSESSTDGMD